VLFYCWTRLKFAGGIRECVAIRSMNLMEAWNKAILCLYIAVVIRRLHIKYHLGFMLGLLDTNVLDWSIWASSRSGVTLLQQLSHLHNHLPFSLYCRNPLKNVRNTSNGTNPTLQKVVYEPKPNPAHTVYRTIFIERLVGCFLASFLLCAFIPSCIWSSAGLFLRASDHPRVFSFVHLIIRGFVRSCNY
jgi:hypothetical protein